MRSQGLLHSVSFRSCKTLQLVNLQFVNSKLQRGQQSWSARDWLLLPIIKWYWTRKTQCTCQVIIEICRKGSMACADFAHLGKKWKFIFIVSKCFKSLSGWGRPFCWTWGHGGHHPFAVLTLKCTATNCTNDMMHHFPTLLLNRYACGQQKQACNITTRLRLINGYKYKTKKSKNQRSGMDRIHINHQTDCYLPFYKLTSRVLWPSAGITMLIQKSAPLFHVETQRATLSLQKWFTDPWSRPL